MPTDSCCGVAETNGLITLGLVVAGGFVYYYQSKWIVGKATAVSGHTIKVGKKGTRVRLHALYALQPGQPWFDAAGVQHDGGQFCKNALAHKVNGKKVKCRIRQADAGWARIAATVYLDCEDVGYWMVRNGYALADPVEKNRHWPTLRSYRRAEKKARKQKLGTHQGSWDLHPRDWIREELRKRDFDPERYPTRDAFQSAIDEFVQTIVEEAAQEAFLELACEWIMVAAL